MNALLIASGGGIALILGLAFIFPCPACKKRRERMRAALARWRENQSSKEME